jgi:hypothetical protein
MKYGIVALFFMTSAVTTVAVAQDGNGHGPPGVIIIPRAPVPTPSTPGPLKKFFLPDRELASMTK